MNIMYLNPNEYQQVPIPPSYILNIGHKHLAPSRSMDIFNGENIGHENAHM